MVIDGRIRVEMEEIQQAIAQFVGRAYGIEIEASKVCLVPSFVTPGQMNASIDVPVQIVATEPPGGE